VLNDVYGSELSSCIYVSAILLGTEDAQQYDRQVLATPLAQQIKARQAAAMDTNQSSPVTAVRRQSLAVDIVRQPDDPHRRRNSRMMVSTSRRPVTHAQKTARAYRHRDSIAVTKLHQEQLQHLEQLHAAACQQQQNQVQEHSPNKLSTTFLLGRVRFPTKQFRIGFEIN
jgi:hypothetical protein